MIAVTAHGLEDLAKALVVGDVVTDKIGLPHVTPFAISRWLFGTIERRARKQEDSAVEPALHSGYRRSDNISLGLNMASINPGPEIL
jgi:hypothetical protein